MPEADLFRVEMKSWPLPVADVFRRVQHAGNGNAAHEAAWLLFEVVLKLSAAAQLAVYLSQPARSPKLTTFLAKALDAPSVGTWNTLLQLTGAALRDAPEADRLPLSGTFARLTRRQRLPAAADFLDFWERLKSEGEAEAAEGAPAAGKAPPAPNVSVSQLFAGLCAYRNHEIGHKGLRGEAHYAAAARRLTAALVEAWGVLQPLADFRLALVCRPRDPRRGPPRGCDVLHGDLSREPWDCSGLPPDVLDRLAEGALVLVNARLLLPLPPLLVYEKNDQDLPVVAFLNGLDRDKNAPVVRAARYLIHHNGQHFSRPGGPVQEVLRAAGALDPPAAPEPPRDLPAVAGGGTAVAALGDYPLLQERGRGPTGVVFRTRHPALRRDVAVKVFAPRDEAGRERLLEILHRTQAAAAAHPARLVQIHDVGCVQDNVYAVLEWVQGGSLGDLLNAGGDRPRFSESAIMQLGAAVAGALEAAHGGGLIHGNLKPENVLLPADWEQAPVQFQNARLTDLGLAPLAAGGVGNGAPYQAPEVRSGSAPADERGDLYGLGAVLFHMATGAPPSGDPAADERLLLSEGADLSTNLVQVILQLLCPDPAGRFRRAAAVPVALGVGPEPAPSPAAETAVEKAMKLSEHGVRLLEQMKRLSRGT